MTAPSIDRIAQLQQIIADFAKIRRVPNLPQTHIRETDTDHTFGLMLTCWYLQPKIAPELNLSEVIKIALMHDIVELHAGDTFAYDEEAVSDKATRESVAVDRLRAEWPDFHEMSYYAQLYIDDANEEVKFVKAVDKMLPVLMTELSGRDEWERIGVTDEMQRQKKLSMQISKHVWPYYDLLMSWLDERGNIPKS